MKLVREYIIYEKFTDESDPIHDMGIGMEQLLKKFLIENNREYAIGDYDKMLRMCARLDELKFVKYLVKSGKANINYQDSIAIKWAIANYDIPMIEFLYDNGARPSLEGVESLFHQYKHTIIDENKIRKILEIPLKKDINEKFTDESDPIKDMGIGIAYKLKQWCKKNEIPFNDKDEVLFQCVSQKQYEFVKYLISTGIDTKGHWDPYAALRASIMNNDLEMARILIDAGSNPFHVDQYWLNDVPYAKKILMKTRIFVEEEQKKWIETHGKEK